MRDPVQYNYGIISYNSLDYQAVLEQHFITFLTEQGASEKTRQNYRSDLRHFMGWTILTLKSSGFPSPSSPIEFVRAITSDLIKDYKFYLLANTIPATTVNRRLSTIRMFFRSCYVYGWIDRNPAFVLTNVPIKQAVHDPLEKMLLHWRKDLEDEGASKSTIKNYLIDVRKFLEWLN